MGATALSTLLSIAPRQSLWGSYTRLDGLLTLLAHVTIFTAVASRLRTRAQWDRLVDVVVAASLPVCAYGIAQASGLETLSWTSAYQAWRISTTLGNPIFAGLVPRAGAAGDGRRAPVLVDAPRRYRPPRPPRPLRDRGRSHKWRRWASPAAAGRGSPPRWRPAQAPCCSRPCGDTGGWPVRRWLPAWRGSRSWRSSTCRGGPLERLRSTAVLGRLAHLFAARNEASPGDRARVLVWQGALRLTRLPAPIVVPGSGPDGAASLRPVVGFGAETMQDVFSAVYDPAFEQAERRNPDISAEGVSVFSTRIPDRSHNETLDSLVTGSAGACSLSWR